MTDRSLSLNRVSFILLALAVIMAIYSICKPLLIGADATKYLVGAEFIQKQNEYLGFTGSSTIHQYRWPPMYSLMIGVGMKLTTLDAFSLIKAIHLGFFVIFALCFRGLLLKKTNDVINGLLFFIAMMAMPHFWVSFTEVGTDFMLLVYVMLILVLISRLHDMNDSRNEWKQVLLISVTALLMCLTRYAGYAFAISTGLWLLLRAISGRKRRYSSIIIYTAIVGAGCLLWLLRNKYHAGFFTVLDGKAITLRYDIGYMILECLRGSVSVLGLPQYFKYVALSTLIPVFLILIFSASLRHSILKYITSKPIILWAILSIVVNYSMFICMLIIGHEQKLLIRYFYFMPLVTIIVCFDLLTDLKNNEPMSSYWKKFSKIFIYLFLTVLIFQGGKATMNHMNKVVHRTDFMNQGITFKPFFNSEWVFQWAKGDSVKKDILCSNFYDYLALFTFRPIYQLPRNSEELAQYIRNHPLKEGERPNIYFVISKNNHWRSSYLPHWKEYLNLFDHEVIRADPYSVIVKVQAN